MRELVANLVVNAAKYAPRSDLSVSLDREGDRARLVVADGGPGIATEARARVFERFARASRDAGGFGVGLWLCRRIAEAHGGTIRLDEREPSGTEFVIELPVGPR
jgi:signal transduction histidine kinase